MPRARQRTVWKFPGSQSGRAIAHRNLPKWHRVSICPIHSQGRRFSERSPWLDVGKGCFASVDPLMLLKHLPMCAPVLVLTDTSLCLSISVLGSMVDPARWPVGFPKGDSEQLPQGRLSAEASERSDCWLSAHLLPCIQSRTAAHGTVLSILRLGLLSS